MIERGAELRGVEATEATAVRRAAGAAYQVLAAHLEGGPIQGRLTGRRCLQLAETVAGLAVVNMVNPGNPFDFGMWPLVSDLPTGRFTGGGGEEALRGQRPDREPLRARVLGRIRDDRRQDDGRAGRSEFQYPALADRTSPGEWQERGSRTIHEQAHERVREILSSHYPTYLDPAVDARIRERFPIRLDPSDMRPGNGRW
jgi:trimethylamine:corrinoid methyltransferase-like protein